MLVDISNSVQVTPAPSSPSNAVPLEGAGNKRPWQGQDDLLPSKLKAKRGLGSSSSPVAAGRSSSPFGFTNSRLAPYDAPTSPSFSKLSTSPAPNNFSSLPPSSPSFARSADLLESVVAAPEVAAVEDDDDDEPLVLRLERGTMMQFGRKAKQRALPCPEATLPIALPKSAKNASRLHCTVKIKPSTSKIVVEIRVIGQNGMKIDGKLWRAGSVAVLLVEAGAKVDLDFWGWSSVVIVAESEKKKRERTVSTRAPVIRMSSPASSAYNSLFDDTGDLSLPEELLPVASSSSSSRAIPASPTHSDHSALSELSSPAHASAALPESRAEVLLGTLGLDLPGLVASQIVFSPRSTVGVEEVIKGLLREVGGMWNVLKDDKGSEDQSEEREDRAVEEWWDVVECVLREQPFFGCIDNAGLKDAAGHPLPPVYFYIPDADPSASRVEALEPFVKRVRGARTSKPVRYFWAKPSLRKNR
ncbi:hypothetical protein BCR35DRAFT_299406 [Leucosporidium creatinivorum]|uniref:FHA domain-containing protein n=1 Tax=Leucosporidium creatinivorum TaxID=106004 RepID=A0A1Y2G1R6_9BASI|nr:hypothetical protein BCR35DRAFT_299406 [Leucosporidium creatinivorum]